MPEASSPDRDPEDKFRTASDPLAHLKVPEPEESLQKVKAFLEEHFDDFVVIARRKNSESFKLGWAVSDSTWARGAVTRVLQDMEVTDAMRIHGDA